MEFESDSSIYRAIYDFNSGEVSLCTLKNNKPLLELIPLPPANFEKLFNKIAKKIKQFDGAVDMELSLNIKDRVTNDNSVKNINNGKDKKNGKKNR